MTSASAVYSMAVAMAGENIPRWMPDALKDGGQAPGAGAVADASESAAA